MTARLAVDVHRLALVTGQQRIRHGMQLVHAFFDAIDCRGSRVKVVGEDGAQPVAVDGRHRLSRGNLVHRPPRGADQVVPAAAPAAVDDTRQALGMLADSDYERPVVCFTLRLANGGRDEEKLVGADALRAQPLGDCHALGFVDDDHRGLRWVWPRWLGCRGK